MADEVAIEEGPAPETPHRRGRGGRLAAKWLLGGFLALVLLLVAALAVLNSPIGQRFITDQIAKIAPASGLKIHIGRIDGNIYGKATLHDVVLSDPKGPFLQVPLVDLDWRPTSWLTRGLDVRNLVTHRGTLLRMPKLNPGDPNAPILPNFDIRIDRFQIENLTVAPGIAGPDAHKVNLLAKADVRKGRVMLKADGRLGQFDRLHALVDAEPDGNKFDIDVDYLAPKGGVIAGMLGAKSGYRAIAKGKGTWKDWQGYLYVGRDAAKFAAFRLSNRAGQYGILGQVYPGDLLAGLPGRLAGEAVSLKASGTLVNSVVKGRADVIGRGLRTSANGTVDLGNNAVAGLQLAARLTDPGVLGPGTRIEGAQVQATLDGPMRALTIEHRLQVARFVSGTTQLLGVDQSGTATYNGARWVLPLDATVKRVVTGTALIDPRLVNGTLRGTIVLAGNALTSEGLRVVFPGANAQLALAGDLAKGAYRLTGPVAVNGLQLQNVGTVDGGAKIAFTTGAAPWRLRADFTGRIRHVTNATLANLAGQPIRFSGGVTMGANAPLDFRGVMVRAPKLTLALDGAIRPGRTTIAGRGRHVDYGPFTVEGSLTPAGPEAVLVFAHPLPAAGLTNVRVAISPTKDGFRVATSGGSLLGEFDGLLNLYAPAGGPTRIAIDHLNIWKTAVTGELTLGNAGIDGRLQLAGGGLDGTILLSPRGGGQGFDADIVARNAHFGGATPIAIAEADIHISGLLRDGHSTITGDVQAQGITYGSLFIGKLAARADMQDGRGTVTASIAGRRGSRFNLQLNAQFAGDRIAIAAQGDFAGRRITMPRRAVLLKQPDGGWRLEPTQINFAGGALIASGELGGGRTDVHLQLADMPLSLIDIFTDLGLGGKISGLVDFRTGAGGVPVGEARVKVSGLTRSGLVLSSKPVDVALVLRLTTDRLETRAVVDEGAQRRGRLQGVISGLPASGPLFERLQAGRLFAQLRYAGPAEGLWRLAAIDAFDLTGPLSVAADVTGSLGDPQVRGSMASDNLRVQSSLSGTDIRNVVARGTFSGSELRLTSFRGTASNGGAVVGSGTVNLQNMGLGRGPQLDIRLAARDALLLNANGLSATVTGPMRIVSDGVGGTIAGRLEVDKASWRPGMAAAEAKLPRVKTREINLPADQRPNQAVYAPWTYLINARAISRIDVDGMGLDSEWSADIRLRGTTDAPRIGGEANMVRGSYSFAGTRFELTRGRINFDENVPIDPRLDIAAESKQNGLDVVVKVQGSAQEPEISFTSNPSLPEEEILARLLFGGSITDLSATDVLQLGAAVASLRGGGGMDPINQFRTAIGLDRLRIVGADPALGRGTAIALGKNIGRRFYVEIITDGHGYSATELEFRVTSWLSLLASVSTVGRDSVSARVSKDY
jgi:translocation and assembly module TamB